MKLQKGTATLITTIKFSIISYLIISFTAWDIDFREWSPLMRFIWIVLFLLPLNNYTKKYVQL